MISRGVEISIAGGRGELVRVLSLGRNQAHFIGIFHNANPGDLSPLCNIAPMTHNQSWWEIPQLILTNQLCTSSLLDPNL